MISKLRKLVKINSQLDKIHRSNDDAYALQIIHKLFPEFCYLPFTPFSLNPYTIVHILNDILFNNRAQIVEFGSGISTIIIARFIKVNKLNTKILSIDNNKDWQEIISKEVKKYNCEENLTLVHAEIDKHNNAELKAYDNEFWYNYEKVKIAINNLDNEIDLVVVDGPSTGTSTYVRYSALPILKTKLSKSSCIFLDDIRRPSEREIITKWNTIINGNLRFEKMYGIITLGDGFSTKPLSH